MSRRTPAHVAIRRVICTALVALTAIACSDITTLKQENPGQILATDAYVPENAQLLVNGAISDFECAFNRYVGGSALFVDELGTSVAATSNYEYDRRAVPSDGPYGTGGCTSVQQPGIYTPLSVARASADTILARLETWTDAEVPNRGKLIAQSAAYAGYSLVLLGEGMCSAAINLGPELTPEALFQEAEARFDKAIAAATAAGDATLLEFALLGRARTRLDRGDAPGAGADAALIPDGFSVTTTPDAADSRRQNVLYLMTWRNGTATVEPSFRDVTWDGAPDPRVAVINTGEQGANGQTIVWAPEKAALATSPMAIARWAEAQLILAEAELAASDPDGAVDIINELHSRAGIAAYDDSAATPDDVRAQIIEERRRELFLEGHRLGDIRRYDLPLSPAAAVPYAFGGIYGDQRCFPLPDVERVNNPNL